MAKHGYRVISAVHNLADSIVHRVIHSFPTRRSSDLGVTVIDKDESPRKDTTLEALAALKPSFEKDGSVTPGNAPGLNEDRKSTRLNSSHTVNSYAVFCLKKKENTLVKQYYMGV